MQNSKSPRSKPVLLLTGLLILSNLVVALIYMNRPARKGPAESRVNGQGQQISGRSAYAGSASCRDCHKEAYEQWQGSHHGLAERPMQPALDHIAFEPPHSFKHGTQNSDARVAPNGRFEIVTMSRKGERQIFSPERVIGVDPLRQFLVTAPGGRYQVTEIAYDPRSNQWFNIYGEEDRQPGEWGHWTGRGMNWNMMCAFCHNTGVEKNYRANSDTYATSMVEASVGCEACHGPMADHVKWQRPRPQPAKGDPTLHRVKSSPHSPPQAEWALLRGFSKDQMRDTCGACHARRAELTGAFQAGDDFFDHYALVIPDETDLYYPDGQVRDEDYEFAAFLGSRMHFSKVRCMDCHQGHTAKIRMPKDDLCLSCHATPIQPAPKIDAATHSFHKRGTPGDHCVDCHMPQTVYMSRHWRRDHGFTIPDPLLTKEHGIPNACNRCHQDKTTDWSIETVNKWYGKRMERPTRERARLMARARAGQRDALSGLLKTAREEAIPYWRAVATLMLRHWTEETNVIEAVLERTRDSHPLVRAVAARALDAPAAQGSPRANQALNQLLSDPVRAVRIDAVWSLRRTVDTNSPAGRDHLRYQEHNSDQPQGLMQKAVWLMDRGDHAGALALLRRAVEWDRFSPPLFSALAVCLSLDGKHEEALDAMQTACKLAPRDADHRFRLALALNEMNRRKEAIAALEETVKLDPAFSRAWYNLGLAYSEQGETDRALEALAKAEKLEPRSAVIPYARATILVRRGQNIEARAAALKALELQPGYPEAATLLQRLPP